MKVMVVAGTRPEAIKMAPVIIELAKRPNIAPFVCVTAQHRQMLDQVMALFSLKADADLDLMRPLQSLNGLTSRIFEAFDEVLDRERPDVVLTHGDTTTSFAASVASFHRGIRVGHVEAGLRTYDLKRPFPEEMNRQVADLVSTYLFAPTPKARDNLLAGRVNSDRIYVTGNTVVDALQTIVTRINGDDELRFRLQREFGFMRPNRKLILVTGHRRESFGEGFENICRALSRIAQHEAVDIVYPVHLNPNVIEPVRRILSGLRNIYLLPPVDYLGFVYLLSCATLVITDSGGVQEEAVSLGKHTLVMRDVTERPEGVEAGLAHLVGTAPDRIVSTFMSVLGSADSTEVPLVGREVYGDGQASRRIPDALLAPWIS